MLMYRSTFLKKFLQERFLNCPMLFHVVSQSSGFVPLLCHVCIIFVSVSRVCQNTSSPEIKNKNTG
jgi:hypothetical protein